MLPVVTTDANENHVAKTITLSVSNLSYTERYLKIHRPETFVPALALLVGRCAATEKKISHVLHLLCVVTSI